MSDRYIVLFHRYLRVSEGRGRRLSIVRPDLLNFGPHCEIPFATRTRCYYANLRTGNETEEETKAEEEETVVAVPRFDPGADEFIFRMIPTVGRVVGLDFAWLCKK